MRSKPNCWHECEKGSLSGTHQGVTLGTNYNPLILLICKWKYNKLLWYKKKFNQMWTFSGTWQTFLLQTFSGYQKKKVLFCDHGSLPLTCRCCSTRLLRCMSMCLALSQVSLHRDVCPRLSDSNLSNRDTVSPSQTRLGRISRRLGKGWVVVKNRKGVVCMVEHFQSVLGLHQIW